MGLSKAPQTEDQKLRGAWLWLARLAALIGYSANIVPVIIGLPLAFANLQNFLPTASFSRWTTGELENAISASGISANFIVAFFLIADLFIIATYWGISLLLLYRYSDRWFGLIVPYILFGIGVGFSIYMGSAWNFGISVMPEGIGSFLNALSTFSWPAFFFSWFIFPDGRFAPSWAWLFALGLPFIYIFGLIVGYESNPWLFPLLFVFIFAGLFSQIYRYMRVSNQAQRQQTKWLLFGLVFFVAATLLAFPSFGADPSQRLILVLFRVGLTTLAWSSLPVALGISLARYRLWDVDELINRALVYGVLTTFFTAVFAASTILINQFSLGLFGQSNNLAPVISAVVVAAIFQPSRKRLEDWIEKRFYPHKKEITTGLIESEPGYWPFISLPKLLDSSLSHISETLKANPVAAYLTAADGRMKPVETLGIPLNSTVGFKPSKKQIEEFGKKRVASFEKRGPFLGLVPLLIPGKQRGLVGAIALGPRTDGRGYSGEDLKALVELGGKIALSIHAIQVRSEK